MCEFTHNIHITPRDQGWRAFLRAVLRDANTIHLGFYAACHPEGPSPDRPDMHKR